MLLRRASCFLRASAFPKQLASARVLAPFSSLPDHEVMGLPALSPTMEAGTIGSWNVKEGDAFEAGSVIAEIETDKATMGFEAQDPGVVAKILVQPGSEVTVGTPILVVVDDADDAAALVAQFAGFAAEGGPEGGQQAAPPPAGAPATGPPSASQPAGVEVAGRTVPGEHLLMPAASHLAKSKGIDVTALAGSGRGGRITKGDVLQALARGTAFPALAPAAPAQVAAGAALPAPAAPAQAIAASPAVSSSVPPPPLAVAGLPPTTEAPGEDVKASTMRKVIAKRLTQSKAGVPHYFVSAECELDAILEFRKRLAKEQGVKVSVNDLIIKSASLALRDVPEMNASFNPSTGLAELNETVDVSVAVATPGGLITPIVTNADKRGLSDITATVRELAGRAREGKLQPHEFQGGTFSVSNLGMFGVAEFSAVVNPPQAVIMAVGGGVRQVLPALKNQPNSEGGEGGKAPPGVRVATVMTARVSCDRRVGDEALAGLFLQSFKNYMAAPERLLL